jgi:hypothetical protein
MVAVDLAGPDDAGVASLSGDDVVETDVELLAVAADDEGGSIGSSATSRNG